MSEPDDFVSDMIAAFKAQVDQTNAATAEFAATVGAFHRALIEQGFERSEAFILVRDWVNSIWNDSSSDG